MGEECKVGGGEVGGRGGSHLSRLHLEIPWRFLSLFAFRFIFFHNSYILFLGLFSLLYRSFLSGLPTPCQSPLPSRAPLASLLIVIINKSIQNIFHAQFVGHVTRHKPSSSIYFRAGFSFRAIYKLYFYTHTDT